MYVYMYIYVYTCMYTSVHKCPNHHHLSQPSLVSEPAQHEHQPQPSFPLLCQSRARHALEEATARSLDAHARHACSRRQRRSKAPPVRRPVDARSLARVRGTRDEPPSAGPISQPVDQMGDRLPPSPPVFFPVRTPSFSFALHPKQSSAPLFHPPLEPRRC
jgi:hypothetical protein